MSNKVDITNWKEFKIGDIFTVKRGKRLKTFDHVKGDINYVAASSNNNGVVSKIDNPIVLFPKNSITFDNFGNVFFQKEKFTASDVVTVIVSDNLDKYSGLFITTLLKLNQFKFSFGRRALYSNIKNEILKLPTTKDGEIDFEWIETFIKGEYQNILSTFTQKHTTNKKNI